MKLNKLKSVAFLATGLFVFTACEKDNNNNTSKASAKKSDLYVSSNTSGTISIFDVADVNAVSNLTATVSGADADGIFYDEATRRLFQFDRTNKKLNAYFSAGPFSGTLSPLFSIDVNAANGRELTVSGNTAVLASSSDSSLYVFNIGVAGFTQTKVQKIGFETWGIQLVGNTLYAVVDKTGDLAVFNNYSASGSGNITPSKRVTIGGIVRTHGLTFVEAKNMMIMTDVADAASDTDGAIHIINNFTTVFGATANGGTISINDQIRIDGANTMLGNPVDVAYDTNNDRIYVAERKTAGGLLLGFTVPTANLTAAPVYNTTLSGASAVYINN